MKLSPTQLSALDRIGRPLEDLYPGGFSQLFQDILDAQEETAAGITADANLINALAWTGGVCARDLTTSPGTLNTDFSWLTFRLSLGKTLLVVPGGTLSPLPASTTSYVECDRSGTVTSNTSGFTTNRFPMFEVDTGASSVTAARNRSAVHVFIGANGVDGSMLSTPAQTKEEGSHIGTISATTKGIIVVPGTVAAASKLTKATFVCATALGTDNTNYWDFGVVNKQTGGGAQTLVDRTNAANSTKTTGGSALVAYTKRDLTLVTLTAGTERDVTGDHVIEWTLTKNGTAANLDECRIKLEFAFQN